MRVEEVATLLTASGVFLTGLAALITACKKTTKKEQPQNFKRTHKYKRR